MTPLFSVSENDNVNTDIEIVKTGSGADSITGSDSLVGDP